MAGSMILRFGGGINRKFDDRLECFFFSSVLLLCSCRLVLSFL